MILWFFLQYSFNLWNFEEIQPSNFIDINFWLIYIGRAWALKSAESFFITFYLQKIMQIWKFKYSTFQTINFKESRFSFLIIVYKELNWVDNIENSISIVLILNIRFLHFISKLEQSLNLIRLASSFWKDHISYFFICHKIPFIK